MRYVAHVAAVIGLLAVAAAIGDFASRPNLVGGLGIVALLVVLALALRRLYGPGGAASRDPRPAGERPARPKRAERGDRPPRGRRPKRAQRPAAERPKARGSRSDGGVWAGAWDASEADEARERRTRRPRRRP